MSAMAGRAGNSTEVIHRSDHRYCAYFNRLGSVISLIPKSAVSRQRPASSRCFAKVFADRSLPSPGGFQQARRDGQVSDSKKLAAEGWKLTALF
jgi:hypothetical protein